MAFDLLFSLPLLFGLLFSLVVIGLGYALTTGRLANFEGWGSHAPLSATKYPYQAGQGQLTQSEHNFYGVLKNCLNPKQVLFCQVRLADFVQVKRGTGHQQRHINQIQSRSVDFLVCDAESLSPLLVIELDDASQQPVDQRRRNAIVDRLLVAADLPLLRIRVQYAYTASELKLAIREKLNWRDSKHVLIPVQSRRSYPASNKQPLAIP